MTLRRTKRALVVPTLSHFEGLAALFASVDVPVLPLVIDNWRHPERSVAASWNEGLRRAAAADCHVAHVINDDVVLRPGCLTRLDQALLLSPYGDLLLASAFEVPQDDALDRALPHRARYSCFAVEPGRFLELTHGGFDEGFSPAFFEDDDMRRRLTLLAHPATVSTGRTIFLDRRIPGADCVHTASRTQLRDPAHPVVSHDRYRALSERYIRKWGHVPGHETFRVPFNGGKDE